jgi:hypothetical protein
MIWAGFVQSILCRSIEIEEKASGWCGEAYESAALLLPVEGGGREDFGAGRAVLERRMVCWWKELESRDWWYWRKGRREVPKVGGKRT